MLAATTARMMRLPLVRSCLHALKADQRMALRSVNRPKCPSTWIDPVSSRHSRSFSGDPSAQQSGYGEEQRTHFGFTDVPIEEKTERVKDVFREVADRYDIMNDFMSAGLHRYEHTCMRLLWALLLINALRYTRLWKDHFIATMNPVPGMVSFRALCRLKRRSPLTVLCLLPNPEASGSCRWHR